MRALYSTEQFYCPIFTIGVQINKTADLYPEPYYPGLGRIESVISFYVNIPSGKHRDTHIGLVR